MKNTPSLLLEQLVAITGGQTWYAGQLGKKVSLGLKGNGAFSFPLNKLQIKGLLEMSRVAPFGKGQKTLVDPEVRNTREIEADQLDLSDPSFQKALKSFLRLAAEEMNIAGGITAVPYKLLIYEAGGFFAEHQDSEKLPGMFGTLLVGLPADHAGGSLLLDPGNGEKLQFDFAKDAARNFPAVAFFADRKHEVLPVVEGYRVVLVFNLVRKKRDKTPSVTPEDTGKIMAPLLEQCHADQQPLVVSLGHQYTEANFADGELKGNDLARLAALRHAATAAGWELRVGLIEETAEVGWDNADEFGQGWDSGYSKRRSRYYDDDVTYERRPGKFSELILGEMYDGHLSIGHWLPEDGKAPEEIVLSEDLILTLPDQKSQDPVDWDVEGYQGNWGQTATYTYRYGGVVLWNAAMEDRLVRLMSMDRQLSWVKEQLPKASDLLVQESIMRLLQDIGQRQMTSISRYQNDFADYLALLITFCQQVPTAVEALQAAVSSLLTKGFVHVPQEKWPPVVKLWGWLAVGKVLDDVLSGSDEYSYATRRKLPDVLFRTFAQIAQTEEKDVQRMVYRRLQALLSYVSRLKNQETKDQEFVKNLLKIAAMLPGFPGWQDDGDIKNLLPALSDADWQRTELAPALLDAPAEGPLFGKLWSFTLGNLRERTKQPPVPFTDWKRPGPEQAEYPKVAKMLWAFMEHPGQESYAYKAREEDRNTVQRFIDRHALDVETFTSKTRPCHTLHLSKTAQSYQRRLTHYEQEVALLADLEKREVPTATIFPEEGAAPSAKSDTVAPETFVKNLRARALAAGESSADVHRALECYHQYFVGKAAAAAPQTFVVVAAVDRLLENWEAEITQRYTEGTDDARVPSQYASLEALWAEAFGAVLR